MSDEMIEVKNNTKQVIGITFAGQLQYEVAPGDTEEIPELVLKEYCKRVQVKKMIANGSLEILGEDFDAEDGSEIEAAPVGAHMALDEDDEEDEEDEGSKPFDE